MKKRFVALLLCLVMVVGLIPAAMAALGYGGLVDSSYLPQSLVTSIDSFPLMAVPFFILAGDLMGHGGISRRLLDVGSILFGRFTGGLGLVAVATWFSQSARMGIAPVILLFLVALILLLWVNPKGERG